MLIIISEYILAICYRSVIGFCVLKTRKLFPFAQLCLKIARTVWVVALMTLLRVPTLILEKNVGIINKQNQKNRVEI